LAALIDVTADTVDKAGAGCICRYYLSVSRLFIFSPDFFLVLHFYVQLRLYTMSQTDNLGPLTTTFTPAAGCNQPMVPHALCPECYDDPLQPIPLQISLSCTSFPDESCSSLTSASSSGPSSCPDFRILVANKDCFPSTTAYDNTADAIADSNRMLTLFYSPGLACPDGRVTACSSTHGGDYNHQFAFTINNDETMAGCCPT
jgi:hypothetical protein